MSAPPVLAFAWPTGFTPEDVLLWAPLATALAGFLAALLYVRGQGDIHLERAERLAWVTASFLTLNLLVLLYYFVTLNFRIEYVHSYTVVGAPLAYRIAGLWGGQKGTILMWGTFAALLFPLNHALWSRQARRGQAPANDPRGARAWTFLVGLGIVLAFIALMILGRTWQPTDEYLLDLRPDGVGLQPVLRTPFMVIHPPLQFVGYALATLLYASGLSAVATRDRHWADVALPWTRVAFLIQFVGLGLGGLWAYYVLNFGGYWAWDPVETANLIALFPTILLLHSLLYYRKRNMFQASAPFFALLTVPATLFSTIATRSGLWVSVHAFTDPTQNFARDPLTRFLNILQTSPNLQFLTSLLLASILGALLVYVARTRQEARSARGWPAALSAGAAFLFAAFLALGFFDAPFALSGLFEASHLLYPPNASIGLGLLILALALALAAPAFVVREETGPPEAAPWKDRWIQTPNLVFVGMLLVALAFLVTFLLDLMSVNGYHRSVYDARAPLVALPILLVLGLALGHPTWGRDRALAWAGLALGLGAALALLLSTEWEVALVAPALTYALAGCATKLYRVSSLGRAAPARLRLAGALLLFGGIAGLVYWSNPPTRVPLLLFDAHPSPWWALVGFPAALLSLLGAVSLLRLHNLRLALAGTAGLAVTLLGGLGPPLAVAALLLVWPHRESFPHGRTAWDLPATAGRLRREYRKTGVYLIHVCLVIGLAGYAASTYLQSSENVVVLSAAQPETALGYRFTLEETTTRGLDPDQGILRDLTAHAGVARGGTDLGAAPLTMWLELEDHYAERVRVERYLSEDVYLRPIRFTVQQGDQTLAFNAHDDHIRLLPGAHVVQAVFSIRTLPAMHLVWGGLWGVATGMLLSLLFGGFRFDARGFPASAADEPA